MTATYNKKTLIIPEIRLYSVELVGIGFDSIDMKNIKNMILDIMMGQNKIFSIRLGDILLLSYETPCVDKSYSWTYINIPDNVFFNNGPILYCNPCYNISFILTSESDIYFNIYLHLKYSVNSYKNRKYFPFCQLSKPIDNISDRLKYKSSEYLNGFIFVSKDDPITYISLRLNGLIYNLDQDLLYNYKYYGLDRKIIYFRFSNNNFILPKNDSEIEIIINHGLSNIMAYPMYDNYLIYNIDASKITIKHNMCN